MSSSFNCSEAKLQFSFNTVSEKKLFVSLLIDSEKKLFSLLLLTVTVGLVTRLGLVVLSTLCQLYVSATCLMFV